MNTPSGLSFPWQAGVQFPFRLFGFILLSAFGHVVTFYLFQVEYPPTATATPPPTRIRVLQPNSPTNRTLLDWIAESDPARLARPPEIVVPLTAPIPYEPSYATPRTAPVTAPPKPMPAQPEFPAAVAGLAVLDTLLAPETPPHSPPTPAPTKLVFSREIADRAPTDAPMPTFTPVEGTTLSPTRFLLGVGRTGKPELVFLQSGSEQKSLDQEAENAVRSLRFTRSTDSADESDIAWGFATFHWGTDVLGTQREDAGKKP